MLKPIATKQKESELKDYELAKKSLDYTRSKYKLTRKSPEPVNEQSWLQEQEILRQKFKVTREEWKQREKVKEKHLNKLFKEGDINV
ncbi:hypothetical protein [endosymbiont GvMRE of Glomus versiforme]|uniref:hypothetical protein n=1 Tax=endosymbiont GvMRE of Glomus versiforme TaxID=2039283 RepID=UPI000EBDC96B|nr:hypothetical protein [endosymbiont GvMRE of Glomus versiforme]RHZ36865.1 hypothetical protein GvMRE_I2g53 [endosymbiont GvMRE of Glomus versiforme]